MIDTIVLMLKQDMFTITQHEAFSPSTEGLYNPNGYFRLGGRSNMVCKQNPTSLELKNGIYKPRLTVTKRMTGQYQFEITLKIEFSVPKLLFGNNFDELVESDFQKVISILTQILQDMCVTVNENTLINAPVSGIHFGKNVVLTDYSTPYMYLKMLSKANINLRLDLNQTDFRNEGHSLKYRANSFEVVLYDKLKDLHKAGISEKRAEEKDNGIQLSIFDSLSMKKPFEVLRMEVRLNRRQKLKQILKRVGIYSDPTFQMIFKTNTAQKILLYYLNEIETGYPSLLKMKASTPGDVLTELIMKNPKMSLLKALQTVGLHELLKDLGVREFRELIKQYSKNSWYLLSKQAEELDFQTIISPFTAIRNALMKFEPLKLVDFQDRMINNDKHNLDAIYL